MSTTEYERPVLNLELLKETLDRIKAKPQAWDQSTFVGVNVAYGDRIEDEEEALCSTVACLAGHAMAASGQWKFAVLTDMQDGSKTVELVNVETDQEPREWIPDHREELQDSWGGNSYEVVARNLLGLTYDQANLLFYGSDYPDDPDEFASWVYAKLGIEASA